MDTLEQAKLAAKDIRQMKSYERAAAMAAEAAAYAAIAQAEQLKRIADILEYQMVDTPRPDPLDLKPLHTVSDPPSEMDNF
jgi:hypothetical protein